MRPVDTVGVTLFLALGLLVGLVAHEAKKR